MRARQHGQRIQMAAELWLPRKLRAPRIQQPRARRACVGELIQIDGCEHRWFEDRAPACTVLVYVDGVVLQVAQAVQAHRDNRVVDAPSTAHRADGTRVPRSKFAGSKKQRELGAEDLEQALAKVNPELLPPLVGRQTALRGRPL